MARSISVKIPTSNVLTMVEDKVAQLKTEIAEYPTKVEEYKVERKAYTKRIAEMVANIITVGGQEIFEGEWVDTIRISNRGYNGNIDLTVGANLIEQFDLGKPPVEPHSPSGYGGTASKLQELEKTLALLRLTPQEFVTSSTYNSVLELL